MCSNSFNEIILGIHTWKTIFFGYVTHHKLDTSGRRLKNAWRNLLKGSCIPTLLKNDRLASNNDTTMKLHKKSWLPTKYYQAPFTAILFLIALAH